MEKDLREVIGNQLILNSPYPSIPEFTVYLLMKLTFSIFILAIKFDSSF